MIRIDIIGQPGAGKTTLLTTLKKKNKKRKWLTNYEALFKVVNCSQETPLKKILLFFLLHSFPLHKRNYTFTRFFTTNQKYNELLTPLMVAFRLKFEKTTNNHQQDIDSIFNSLHNYLLQIKEICLIQDYCNDKVVIFDESLTQHTDYTILKKLYTKEYKTILPDGVIHVTANPETIKKRLIQRDIKNKNTNCQDKIEAMGIDALIKRTERKANYLEEIGIPILTLNTSQNNYSQYNRVNEWIANHFIN